MGRREEDIDKGMKNMAEYRLKDAIRYFLAAHDHKMVDKGMIPKIGRFILTLASVEPPVPLQGKRLRDLSTKQRILFQSEEYEGTIAGEFLGNWVEPPSFYFLFSKRTVNVAKGHALDPPSAIHKTLAHLCHERPDPVISYGKLVMAVPRFVRDMQGKMKYMSVPTDYQFENAEKPGKGLWIRTYPVNVLLSILDHQDMHIRRERDHAAIYNRWFAAYFEGE